MPDEAKIPNYPGNSQAKKDRVAPTPETPRKMERVTTSDPIKVKKSLGKRISETFTGDDMHSVGSYLLFEVFIPAAKNMIVEGVEQGIQRMLFGDSHPRSRTASRGGYTPYNRMSTTVRNTTLREEPRSVSRAAQESHDFSNVVVASRPEAMMVLESLIEATEVYETVTVADFYSLVGITPSFVDNQWGWERGDISVNDIRRRPEGYMFTLPKPIHLK